MNRLLNSVFCLAAATLSLAPIFAADGVVTIYTHPPDTGTPPAYIRVFVPTGVDPDYVPFWFWRLPACVPPDFVVPQLYDFTPGTGSFAFRAYLCPLVITGRSVFADANDLATLRSPLYFHFEGANSVQVVFLPKADAAALGSKFTFQQLMAVPGKIMGLARTYAEDVSPDPGPGGGGSKNSWIEITATGVLFDGRTFQFHTKSTTGDWSLTFQ